MNDKGFKNEHQDARRVGGVRVILPAIAGAAVGVDVGEAM